MGQLTKEFVQAMEKNAVDGKHTSLTTWEELQFARAWLERHMQSETRADKWVVWAHEHQGYWPASRCGYVALHEAGHFTFAEALAIVRQGNYGMGSTPEETMMPAPGRPHG